MERLGGCVFQNIGRGMRLNSTWMSIMPLLIMVLNGLSWNVAFEAVGWTALAFVKFLVTPASAVAAGVDPIWAFVYSASGAAIGLVAMQPIAKALFNGWSRLRKQRGKRTFTTSRRRLVNIKLRFGLLGIAAISGVIGVPVAGLVAFKYFGHERRTVPILIVAYVVWSAILTFAATTAFV